jgi:hypothetical protein
MRRRYYLDFWTAGGGPYGVVSLGESEANWVEVTSPDPRKCRSTARGFGRTGLLLVHSG